MHTKLIVVDDLVGITGGRNYQNDYYDPYYKDTYGLPRDTQIIWEEAGA